MTFAQMNIGEILLQYKDYILLALGLVGTLFSALVATQILLIKQVWYIKGRVDGIHRRAAKIDALEKRQNRMEADIGFHGKIIDKLVDHHGFSRH